MAIFMHFDMLQVSEKILTKFDDLMFFSALIFYTSSCDQFEICLFLGQLKYAEGRQKLNCLASKNG